MYSLDGRAWLRRGSAKERQQSAQAQDLDRGSTDGFYDDWAIQVEDEDPDEPDDRFLMLGMIAAARTLVVCHCYREEGSVIRIISARRANKPEREDYHAPASSRRMEMTKRRASATPAKAW